jgi:hypothetical protein
VLISDIQPDQDLILYCERGINCNGMLRLTQEDAVDRFGGDFPLATIRERAKCIKCEFIGAKTIVQYVGQTGMLEKEHRVVIRDASDRIILDEPFPHLDAARPRYDELKDGITAGQEITLQHGSRIISKHGARGR